jgi:6-pyruvoyltetrahydropterin/6-carboxytetrahydropterin synthase
MKTQSVTFTRTFAAAHRLYPYEGKCANIHGHNYTVVATIDGPVDVSTGFVVEFDHVKQVIDALDHSLILQFDDPVYNHLLEIRAEAALAICAVSFMPTTENLAHHLAYAIRDVAEGTSGKQAVTTVSLELYETSSIMAKVVTQW